MKAAVERKQIDHMRFMDETPLVVRLPRSDIYPDPTNRKERSQVKLEGLANTMLPENGGQLQPILVWEAPGKDGYQIVFGEGRWLAAGINEEKTGEPQFLDVVIIEGKTSAQIKAMQIIENLQREDPTEMQYALAFRALIDSGEYKTHKEVADLVGVSASTVSVYLSVLDGPAEVIELVTKGIATMDTARTVAEVAKTNPAKAEELVEQGNRDGKLKREVVREAHAEEKEKIEPTAKTKAKTKDKAPAAGPNPAVEDDTPQTATPRPMPVSGPVLIPVRNSIHVAVHADSDQADEFHEKARVHGAATLADDLVHADSGRAWIRFGQDTPNDELMSIACIDLEILKIVRRA